MTRVTSTTQRIANGFSAVVVLLIIVIAGILGGTGYYVFNAKNAANGVMDSAAGAQDSPVKSKASTKTAADGTLPLVAGQVDFDVDHRRGQGDVLFIDGYIEPSAELKGVWLEYGKSATNLDKQTVHQTSELGLGTAGYYGNFTFPVSTASLDPGAIYFYRIAAERSDGSLIHSDTAGFTNKK
jgi:hypothetical protein